MDHYSDRKDDSWVTPILQENKALKAKVDELTEDRDLIEKRFIEAKEYYRARLATEDKRVDALQAKVEKLETALAVCDVPVKRLTAKVDELTAALKAIRAGQAGDPVICATNALKQEVSDD